MTFTEIIGLSDKNWLQRIIRTCNLLSSSPISDHSTTKLLVKDKIFTSIPIHAPLIFKIHRIRWI